MLVPGVPYYATAARLFPGEWMGLDETERIARAAAVAERLDPHSVRVHAARLQREADLRRQARHAAQAQAAPHGAALVRG